MPTNFLVYLLFVSSVLSAPQGQENTGAPAVNIIYQSVDGGQTWQDVSAGLPEDLEVGCVFAGDGEVFLGSERGLYRSAATTSAPVWGNNIALDKRIVQIFPGRDGPYACTSGDGFFQKITGTDVWVPMHHALVDKSVRVVMETLDGSVFVGCDSGIFKSTDRGKTWRQVFTEGVVTSFVAMGDVLVGGGYRGVLRSTDSGEHWNWVQTGVGAAYRTELFEGGVLAITFDGSTNHTYTSTDKGQTWQLLEEDLSPVRLIYNVKQAGKYHFYSHGDGISRSSDGGKTWELVLPSTGMETYDLAVSGKVIFAIRLVGC